MLKGLVDIDVRKVTAVAGLLIFICVPLAQGQVPLAGVVPDSWIPHIEAYASLIAWFAGILTGTHNTAALISPRAPEPLK
jgi:hypothetical protein